ncbi:MAG TPA: glutathione synthase [Candidatus Binatia bacterium]|nr:glutathione synthase [Candidatus Binatia bacterium]
MRFLFVIDPLDSLNLETETSLLMMEEAARRGHANFICTIDDLWLTEQDAHARARAVTLSLSRQPFYTTAEPLEAALRDFDVVVMRKDPPVDARYLAATFVLERAAASIPVINNPVSLRTVNEKLLPLSFRELAPPTLVTNSADRIAAFVRAYGRSILKPLDQCSGRGIRLLPHERDVRADLGKDFVLVQQFIDAVRDGDKRIFALEGKVLGAVNRVPRRPEDLANIHQGARVEATTITPRDQEIIDRVAPTLKRLGLWMAGIDIIGGYLTEINVTSPSAARQINAVSGTHIERQLVNFLERRADQPMTAT